MSRQRSVLDLPCIAVLGGGLPTVKGLPVKNRDEAFFGVRAQNREGKRKGEYSAGDYVFHMMADCRIAGASLAMPKWAFVVNLGRESVGRILTQLRWNLFISPS